MPATCKVSISKKNKKRKPIGCGFHNPKEETSRLKTSQKQLMEIAKALFFHARLLILDERSTSLNQEEERFIILTTQANASVNPVHNRMPLVLDESELEDWVYDDKFMEYALHKTPPELW